MIYLDNSATTKPCEAAMAASREMQAEMWHNPSSPYRQAVRVEKRITACREAIAGMLGAKASGVLFTAGGTEADSLATLGSAARFRGPSRVLLFQAEHSAVQTTAAELERMGHKVSLVPATAEGVIDLEALSGKLSPEVRLVSCMHVGNETGAVQPLAEIARMLGDRCPEAVFHVDGAQGFLRLPVDLPSAGIDLYAISGHKIHGPKGVGALVCGPRAKLSPRVTGGGQEQGLRSGTENTAGIAALAAAAEWVRGENAAARLKAIKMRIVDSLRQHVAGLRVNGPDPASGVAAPHIVNVSFPGIGGEVLLHALEEEGVLVGTGSACSSKRRVKSPAFEAMGAPDWAADSALRISVGLYNTLEEAEKAADAIVRCYHKHKNIRRK